MFWRNPISKFLNPSAHTFGFFWHDALLNRGVLTACSGRAIWKAIIMLSRSLLNMLYVDSQVACGGWKHDREAASTADQLFWPLLFLDHVSLCFLLLLHLIWWDRAWISPHAMSFYKAVAKISSDSNKVQRHFSGKDWRIKLAGDFQNEL
jgi:hypothetical protein